MYFLLFLVLSAIAEGFRVGVCFRSNNKRYRQSLHCTTQADRIVEDLQEFLEKESLVTLVPRDQVMLCVDSIHENEEFWLSTEGKFNELWAEYDAKIRTEGRKISEIIGEESTRRLLENVQKVDVYDAEAVKAFLQSQAIEKMIGGILYEGIFEFIQRVDIIGGVVNNLPIIGPIRQQIVSEFKKNLDRVLGTQVKEFLGSFNRVAVQRMISFVLSEDNRQSLAKANSNLVSSILQRPINSLLPSSFTSEKLKEELWSALRNLTVEDTKELVNTVYEYIGSKKVGEIVDFRKVVKVVPATNEIAVNVANRFLEFQSIKRGS